MYGVPRIAGAGVCCIDHIVTAPRIRPGETGIASDYFTQGGGLIGTALVTCARLGAEALLFSLLGDDAIGDQIVAGLADEGVSTAGVARITGGKSPFSFIHVDEHSGERTIFHRPGTDLKWRTELSDLAPIAQCDVLLVDDIYVELATQAAEAARANSIPVVGDMTPGERNAHILRELDVLIAPRHFARGIGCGDDPGRALDTIHEYGTPTAVITLGADGWVYSDPQARGQGTAFQVEVVDTTGAGDVFHGAFAYGLARGWDTARCCEFAGAVAAIKCTKAGGRTALPTLGQTLQFLWGRSTLDWSNYA